MSKKIVLVTGTKGKTTISNLLDSILLRLNTGKETLRVSTEGHFLNGKRRSTSEPSHVIYGFAPTVCPGRYLIDLSSFSQERLDNMVAILEASLGSGNACGTGVGYCDVGVWTNVFEDHLGSSEGIKTREDIAELKSFVFSQIRDGGYAVFNACDRLVCSKTELIKKGVTIIPCYDETKEAFYDLKKHLKNGGTAFVLRETKIIKKTQDGEHVVYDASQLPWTFEGQFKPSMLNLLLTFGAIYAIHDGHFPKGLRDVVNGIRLDPYGGRLTLLKAKKGTTIIADYAHETESLRSIGGLAKSIAERNGGKTIAVIRISYDRTDKLIRKTGHDIGKAFDEFIVYDKIDGYWKKASKHPGNPRFSQRVGRIARLLGAAISKRNKNTKVIIREDKAIEYASGIAQENDVVVIIVNDNIYRSIDWIREMFDAKFAK